MSSNRPNEETALTDPSVTNAINAELYTTRLKSKVYDLLVEIEQLQREIQSRQQQVQQLNAEIVKNK